MERHYVKGSIFCIILVMISNNDISVQRIPAISNALG